MADVGRIRDHRIKARLAERPAFGVEEVAHSDLVLARHRLGRELHGRCVDVETEESRTLPDRAQENAAPDPRIENRRGLDLADRLGPQCGYRIWRGEVGR